MFYVAARYFMTDLIFGQETHPSSRLDNTALMVFGIFRPFPLLVKNPTQTLEYIEWRSSKYLCSMPGKA